MRSVQQPGAPRERCGHVSGVVHVQERLDGIQAQLDSMGKRLDRIERRLELVESPAAG